MSQAKGAQPGWVEKLRGELELEDLRAAVIYDLYLEHRREISARKISLKLRERGNRWTPSHPTVSRFLKRIKGLEEERAPK